MILKHQSSSSRGGRGRGRGGRGRGRGHGKGGNNEDEDEWSMQKYDFEAPDIKQAIEGHKPNFVKAPKRVFEKNDGYQSDEKEVKNEEKEDNCVKKSEFKRVSKEEWNNMTKSEKKKYLKERKKWKLSQTVFIKDDSDNEQLTDDDDDNDEDLKYSDSEEESEKQERLAREALKSYAGAFKKDEAPEDYHLVMRKDVVEKELADTEDTNYETAEDIEIREKRARLELKEQEKKAKMREERLRRMQAFQASSILREEPEVEEGDEEEKEEDEEEEKEESNDRENMDTDDYEVNITTEVKPIEENPFYSSYDALETKDDLEDPLKEERERIRVQQEEDEKELKKLQQKTTPVFEEPEEIAPPKKKTKIEISQMSSLGALKTMIESEKDKIQKEMDHGEEKTKMAEQKQQDAKKKKAEQVLRRSRRRGDPNNPSKEEVDAAQELEQMTWQDRYMKNKKVKDVVEKSQLLSKVKNKLKEDKKEKEQESAPGVSDPPAASTTTTTTSQDPAEETGSNKESMIGSIEEYASLVGTSVSKLADTKYEAPEVEPSEDEEESDNEGDDL